MMGENSPGVPEPEGMAPVSADRRRGRLKIFLGYAPGVGKTTAILEAAHQRLEEGVDVVAGLVETHGRPELDALLDGLETVNREAVAAGNGIGASFDLDGVLRRKPELVLIDDLAHENGPEARHRKRYHDVLELLDAGIGVYTTVNIQHLESLNDIVFQITGVVVPNTIPDRLLDEADEIELVDLPIEELQQRVEEGKVGAPDLDREEAKLFFRPGNLNALRELTLRRAADRIDETMREYMRAHGITGPWPAAERVLVCVGPSPLSVRLVRAGKRLASRLNAEWFAVYVETPAHLELSEEERDGLAATLRLAEELGARSVMLPGQSIAAAIAWFAKSRNVTKIMVGRPLQPRWKELLKGSVVDQIVRHSGDTDVYVMSAKSTPQRHKPAFAKADERPVWPGYVISSGLVALATVVALPLRPIIEPTNLVMLYLLAVIVSALRWGQWPAATASLLSVLAFDLVFVPPYFDLTVSDAEYLLTFAGLLAVGLLVGTLTARTRQRTRAEQQREALTMVLYQLSRDLAGAADIHRVAQIVVRHVEETLGRQAVVLAHEGDGLETYAASAGYELDENEWPAAMWAMVHNAPAGHFTDTLAGARGYYLPLKTAQEAVGVLGVWSGDGAERPALPTPEHRRLLGSFASQAAVAMERSRLADEARRAQLLHETEKLQTALLNSISHDLRTPLAMITGALSSLRDDSAILDATARGELIQAALDEAGRLNRLVGNLLKMTQLESGALQVTLEPQDIEDVIGVTLAQLAERLRGRQVEVDIPDDLPLAPMDFVLMTQVFVNLLENGHKYSAPGKALSIRACSGDEVLRVEVMDRGRGIAKEMHEQIFEKFYRLPGASDVGGTGLGLSISRGIVEAHGGRVWAEAREGGGSTFVVELPLQQRTVAGEKVEA